MTSGINEIVKRVSWPVPRGPIPAGELAPLDRIAEVRHDRERLSDVVRSWPGGSVALEAQLQRALRLVLARAHLDRAQLIGDVLESLQQLKVEESVPHARASTNIHYHDLVGKLVEGISYVLERSPRQGLERLARVLADPAGTDESLRWLACIWTAAAAAQIGEMDKATRAARRGLSLGKGLDREAQMASLFQTAEIHFLSGEHGQALDHLDLLVATCEEAGSDLEAARARMAQACIFADHMEVERAATAAKQARDLDPSSTEPCVFLAERALVAGDQAEARRIVEQLRSDHADAPEVLAVQRLLEMSEGGTVEVDEIQEYFWFRDGAVSSDAIAVAEDLVQARPDFHHLRLVLAWRLLEVGREERAAWHFRKLVNHEDAPEIHRSALLGLGCLASRSDAHHLPSGWVGGAEDVSRYAAQQAQSADDGGEASAETGGSRDRSVRHASGGFVARSAQGSAVPATDFSGPIEMFGVPDLLEFLRSSRRTGTLLLVSEFGTGAVRMHGGMLLSAGSPLHALPGGNVAGGAVSGAEDEPSPALFEQTVEAVAELLGWEKGEFFFEPDKASAVSAAPDAPCFDTQAVVLEALRRVDERRRGDSQ